MSFVTATQSTWFLIGPIAKVLGYVMNGIFVGLDRIGLPNIGVAIILFTLVIKALMIPLSIKQQKFSKLQAIMQPELQAVQNKYKGAKDNASLMAQQAEQKEIYAKYGASPTGGCLQVLIQMPILLALYQVIYHMPGYIDKLKQYYQGIAQALMKFPGALENSDLVTLATSSGVRKAAESFASERAEDFVIDMMYNLSPAKWTQLFEIFKGQNTALVNAYTESVDKITKVNTFLGIDLSMTPKDLLAEKVYIAILIPILAGVFQWLSAKLTQQGHSTKKDEESTAQSMSNTMNIMFPIMSVVFCFMFNAGIGLYWVASSVVQVLIQLFVNNYINKVDLNEMVRQNLEKENIKRIKRGEKPLKVNNISTNVRSLEDDKRKEEEHKKVIAEKTAESTQYYASRTTAKKGSLAEKAGMVQQYEERVREQKSGKKTSDQN